MGGPMGGPMGGQERSRRRCGTSSRLPDAPGGSPARPKATSQGFRAASRAARDAPHRHATRSLPKTFGQKTGGSRLYELLSALLGINPRAEIEDQKSPGESWMADVETKEVIGFVGLGGMGRGLVKNLLKRGFDVTAQ